MDAVLCRDGGGGLPRVTVGPCSLPLFAKPTDFSARKYKLLSAKNAKDLDLEFNVF